MSAAEEAFAAARAEIAKAKAEGWERLGFDRQDFRALERIPEEIRDCDALRLLDLDNTKVSDLTPLSGLTGLTGLTLDNTPVVDLRPIRGLRGLAEEPDLWGLTFKHCAACEVDPEIARISEIEDNKVRAAALFAYLEDWVPPGEGQGGYGRAYGQHYGGSAEAPVAPKVPRPPEDRPFVAATSRIGTREIRTLLRESYPDLRDRSSHLVALIQQERAVHALVPRPNEDAALRAYEEKEEFLKTMEAGLVSLHEDIPSMPVDEISEAKAETLRDRLTHLARLADATVRYLDEDKGTYGGLYKIGLISGVAGLLTLIPGVTFVSGAVLPTVILGAQTIRLHVKRDM